MYVWEGYRTEKAHVRRVTLRTDGFASINAPDLGGELITKQLVFAGRKLAINYSTSALGSVRVCDLDFIGRIGGRRDVVSVHELWQGDERLAMGVVPFVPNKHLALGDPELRVTVRETDGGFAIELAAARLARFVWLTLGADVVFSDNYFDLPAGRTVTVMLPALERWTAGRVRQSLRVRSLVDALGP